MKIWTFFILAILIILFIAGCSKPEKKEVGYNITTCEKLCNESYIGAQNQLEACWNSCESFGTKGDSYYKYMNNLSELKNKETS